MKLKKIFSHISGHSPEVPGTARNCADLRAVFLNGAEFWTHCGPPSKKAGDRHHESFENEKPGTKSEKYTRKSPKSTHQGHQWRAKGASSILLPKWHSMHQIWRTPQGWPKSAEKRQKKVIQCWKRLTIKVGERPISSFLVFSETKPKRVFYCETSGSCKQNNVLVFPPKSWVFFFEKNDPFWTQKQGILGKT